MADMTTMDAMELVRNHLEAAGEDQLREMVKMMAEGLMDAEAQSLCGAPHGVSSPERVNQRNGYRSRRWDTRVGSIELAVPKLRKGSYFPEWLLRARKRSEQALMGVVAECYLQGVSTRKVDAVVQQLGIEGISKSQVSELAQHLDVQVESFRNRRLDAEAYPYVWLDAMYVKSREDGRIANVAVIVATGVNAQGYREILGMDVNTTEDSAGWTGFLRGLVARGLKDVKLVISDSHEGLKHAIAATLPGASWQRCRTHFMRNLLTRVPKSAQGMVATLVRGIFAQSDEQSTWSAHGNVVQQLEKRFPEAAKLLDQAAGELLAFTAFPKAHWKQIWSNNPQERLNKELRRRSDVVGIFPNRPAIIRLLGAVLAEQHDEWAVIRRYLTIGPLDALVQKPHDADEQETLAMTA
jgi:transposase-like protein